MTTRPPATRLHFNWTVLLTVLLVTLVGGGLFVWVTIAAKHEPTKFDCQTSYARPPGFHAACEGPIYLECHMPSGVWIKACASQVLAGDAEPR